MAGKEVYTPICFGATNGCLIPLGAVLLITGGIMVGICHDATTTGNCNGNDNIATTGMALLITGAVMEGIVVLMCCCLSTIVCCTACSSSPV